MLKTRIKNLDIFFCMRAVKNQKTDNFLGRGGLEKRYRLKRNFICYSLSLNAIIIY